MSFDKIHQTNNNNNNNMVLVQQVNNYLLFIAHTSKALVFLASFDLDLNIIYD